MENDKRLHFAAGGCISLATGIIAAAFTHNILIIAAAGIAMAAAGGLAKDYIYDRFMKQGVFEWPDILATISGGCLSSGILMIIFAY